MDTIENEQPRKTTPAMAQERVFGTVLFSDLCGSSAIGHRVEPEELAEIVQQVEQTLTTAIEAHGGTVVQMQGDGVLAVFGYPISDENAPRNAIDAALSAHEGFRDRIGEGALNGVADLRLHSGVHSGVFVAKPGNAVDGRYAFFGDTVNIASHLCDAADRDEIVVSDATLGGIASFFSTRPANLIDVKGQSGPLAAHRVTARAALPNRFAARELAGLTDFVGRRVQNEALMRNLELSQKGEFRAVALIGEAGIGKTRLAKEFVARARAAGHIGAEGFCESFGACGPLQPIRHMILDMLDLPPNAEPDVARSVIEKGLTCINPELAELGVQVARILDFASGRDDAGVPMDEVVDVLCTLCLAISQDKSLILSVDDWQWADDSSRLLLGKIVSSERRGSILLVVTSREFIPDDTVLGKAEIVHVDPLDFSESREAISSLTGATPSGDLLARIIERSGGNPLYLEEIAHLLSNGAFDKLTADGDFAPSATIQELIKSRLAHLSERDLTILRAASVIGNVVDLDLLNAITPETGDLSAKDLASTGLMMRGATIGEMRFKHGISRDVVYQSIDLATRRDLHRAVAMTLTEKAVDDFGESSAELLAYHHSGAGDHAKARIFAEAAGDRALQAAALDRTRSQFVACVHAMDHLQPNVELKQDFINICNRFSQACVYGPSHNHVSILTRAVGYAEELGEKALSAQLNRWAGYFEYVLGDQRGAIRYFERALDNASRVKRRSFSTEIRANLGQAYAAACEYDAALAYLNEVANAGASVRSRSGAPPVSVAYALAARALVFADRGEFDRATVDFEAALNKYGGSGQVVEASIRNMWATAELWRGDAEKGLAEARIAAEKAERSGATYVQACANGLIGRAYCLSGREVDGVANLRKAVSTFERRDLRLFSSIYHGWLAQGLCALGDFDGAEDEAEKALARGERKDLFGAPMAHRVLASIYAKDEARRGEAAERLMLARTAARARGSIHEEAATDLLESSMLRRAGLGEDADRMAGSALRSFTSLGMSREAALARSALSVA